jgi:hypothetical protein
VLDGKVFRTDRSAQTTPSVKGNTINSWYSGRHHGFGGNIQALMRPDGLPIWVSDVVPGHATTSPPPAPQAYSAPCTGRHPNLGLPSLADAGYDGAGQGIHTPIKQPGAGQVLAPDNQIYNTLPRSARCRGERGFALLTGRWRALRQITASTSRIGDYTKAALVLTHIEQTPATRSLLRSLQWRTRSRWVVSENSTFAR